MSFPTRIAHMRQVHYLTESYTSVFLVFSETQFDQVCARARCASYPATPMRGRIRIARTHSEALVDALGLPSRHHLDPPPTHNP